MEATLDQWPVLGLWHSCQAAGEEPTAQLFPLAPQPDCKKGQLHHHSEPRRPAGVSRQEGGQREDAPRGDCLPVLPGVPRVAF